MKILTSGVLVLSLSACTAHVRSTPGSRRHSPPPPPPSQPAVVAPQPQPQPPPPPPPAGPPIAQPPPPAEGPWVQLAPPQRNDDNRDFIDVGKDQGRFRQLRLDVTRGSLVLRQVVVEYGNGEQQKVRVDRTLDARADHSLLIDLEGKQRTVVRVLVYMDPAQSRRDRGAYRLFGL